MKKKLHQSSLMIITYQTKCKVLLQPHLAACITWNLHENLARHWHSLLRTATAQNSKRFEVDSKTERHNSSCIKTNFSAKAKHLPFGAASIFLNIIHDKSPSFCVDHILLSPQLHLSLLTPAQLIIFLPNGDWFSYVPCVEGGDYKKSKVTYIWNGEKMYMLLS